MKSFLILSNLLLLVIFGVTMYLIEGTFLKSKMDTYEYLLLDHEVEINRIKKRLDAK